MSVKVEGFKFAALKESVRKAIAEELNSGAASVVAIAKELAPVDTGYMRDHIEQTDRANPNQLRAVIESQADYSAFVEYGTVHMDAQPFFTPAFESGKKQVNNGLLRVLKVVR